MTDTKLEDLDLGPADEDPDAMFVLGTGVAQNRRTRLFHPLIKIGGTSIVFGKATGYEEAPKAYSDAEQIADRLFNFLVEQGAELGRTELGPGEIPVSMLKH